MTTNLYNSGDAVYLRESAARGFIEAVKISGVHQHQNGWLYTINVSMFPPGAYQDRRSGVSTSVLYYTESEFVTMCGAYAMAEASAKLTYDRLKAQRLSLCGSDSTAGTD